MAEHGPSSELTITCGIPQETDHAATRSLGPRWLAQHADEISLWQEIELDLHAAQRKRGGTPQNIPDEAHGTVGRHRSPGQVAAPAL